MLFTRASCAGHTSAKWDFIDAVICLLSRHRATPRWGVGRSHFFTNPSRRVKSNDLAWAEWKGESLFVSAWPLMQRARLRRVLSLSISVFWIFHYLRGRARAPTHAAKQSGKLRKRATLSQGVAASLHYPNSFSLLSERCVCLTGGALITLFARRRKRIEILRHSPSSSANWHLQT